MLKAGSHILIAPPRETVMRNGRLLVVELTSMQSMPAGTGLTIPSPVKTMVACRVQPDAAVPELINT
jgi:hypothetical protein